MLILSGLKVSFIELDGIKYEPTNFEKHSYFDNIMIALDKIIQSLYEDKVSGKLSEECYIKMSDNYEAEQKELTEKVKILKAEIEKAQTKYDNIQKFMAIVKRYSDFEELTPEILRAFVDKIIIYEDI